MGTMKRALVFALALVLPVGLSLGQGQTPAPKPPAPRRAAPKAPAPARPAFDKAKFEAYLRHLYVWGDEIKMDVQDPVPSSVDGLMEIKIKASYNAASDERSYLISRDGSRILDAKVYETAKNPFQEDLDLLHTDGAPSFGTPGAPVVIVMFSDFQCPYCKGEAQMLRTELLKAYPKEVRVYFKDMPLQTIHPWARKGALAGRCAYAQGEAAFWKWHDWIYEKQEQVSLEDFDIKAADFAATGAVKKDQFDACRQDPKTAAALDAGIAEARAMHINSTPTMFINGRRITSTLRWEGLADIIDFEIGYQKREHNAGEACCSVALPTAPGAGR
jgi:protein-disulfide isomerase